MRSGSAETPSVPPAVVAAVPFPEVAIHFQRSRDLFRRGRDFPGGDPEKGIKLTNSHFSHLYPRLFPIERLLPPRFLRGEKVAKPDEGGVARFDEHVLCERERRLERPPCVLFVQRCRDSQTPPHPAFGHLLPH